MSASPRPRAQAMVGRVAVVALPTFSVVVAALVFLGPGTTRPSVAARVRGAPVEGARVVAVRIEILRALYEVLDGGGIHELLVEASAPGQTLRAWHGSTGPDGIAEVRMEASAPIRGPVALAVTALAPRQRVLAAGEIPLGKRGPELPAPGARVVGNIHGDLEIQVQPLRGVLAAPFDETVRVTVLPAQRTALEISGPGLEASPSKVTTDDRGQAIVKVKPFAHQVELAVDARAGDKHARWEGTLPVVPGAMWLDPTSAAGAPRTVLSPAPRERGYASFWTEEGRVGGAVIPLAKDGRGFHAGELSIPDAPDARVLFVTLAGDALEEGVGTVGWPLRPAEGSVTPPGIRLLLDGLPAAEDREKARAAAARRTGLLLVGAAALAEMFLLLALGRASQRRLEAHFADASEHMPEADRSRLRSAAREHPALNATLAVALVGLAFALVAALSSFR